MSSSSHSTHSSSNVVGVHYRVGKKIGEGSFGIIYEGKFLPLPTPPTAKKKLVKQKHAHEVTKTLCLTLF